MLEILFVCGMSGAGKTTAQHTLEDLGYMCIDNMPPTFISKVIELMNKQGQEDDTKIAFIFDVKYHSVKQIVSAYSTIKLSTEDSSFNLDMLFLDAQDKVLLGRYRETRRKHPLAGGQTSLAEGIEKERELLKPVRELSTIILDTSLLSVKDLMTRLQTLFTKDNILGVFNVTFMSFGFKHGVPVDADFVLDVRFLPNPFYEESLRIISGEEQPVIDYVMEQEETNTLLEKTKDYLGYLLKNYKKNKRNNFIVAIGCTGGQHRSVVLASQLYQHFSEQYTCFLQHRDMDMNILEVKKRFNVED